MSYTKREWATGNVVGAVDLNRIENGIADIDVDEIRGWSVDSTQLFSETVTTVDMGHGAADATLAYSTLISADTITVTIDGTDYVCDRIELAEGQFAYGGFDTEPDFTNYPFFIFSTGGQNSFGTQTAGTFTVAVVGSGMQVSTDFGNAVNTCVVPQVVVATANVTTWQAIYDAVSSGKIVCIVADEADYKTMHFVASIGIDSGGNYHIETVAALNSAVEIANYYANSANDPIYSN